MKVLNFGMKTIDIISSYLEDRRQYVQIEHIDSEIHPVGRKSVTQGSTLSCLFFIIYILDIPQIGHSELHDAIKNRQCSAPNIDTFMDDNYVRIVRNNKSLESKVLQTITEIKNYMDANCMALNPDKSKIMIVSKDKKLKDEFNIKVDGKTIKHSPMVNILGISLDENLSWETHLAKNLLPNLKNRIRTLKLTTRFMNSKFRREYTGAIFCGKLLYGIEIWGGIRKSCITKVQDLQSKAAKIALQGEKNNLKLSDSQRHSKLKWLSIQKEVEMATHKMTQKIINVGFPAYLNLMMPINLTAPRMQVHHKLSIKPKKLNSTELYRSTFRSRAYNFNTLPGSITSIRDPARFKKWTKTYMITPSLIPKELNRKQMDKDLASIYKEQTTQSYKLTPPPPLLTLPLHAQRL